jgi:hypothetical protein
MNPHFAKPGIAQKSCCPYPTPVPAIFDAARALAVPGCEGVQLQCIKPDQEPPPQLKTLREQFIDQMDKIIANQKD